MRVDMFVCVCVFAEETRSTVYLNDGIGLIIDCLRRYRWDEELCVRAMWALATMATSHGMQAHSFASAYVCVLACV